MYYHLLPLPLSVIAIILYTIARSRFQMERVKILQPSMTALALLIAILSLLHPDAITGYSLWIIAGLAVSLGTDLLHIDMRRDNILMIGIVGFSVAYMIYPIGITVYNGFHPQDIIVGSVLLVAYIATIAYFWKSVKGFRIPVIVYSFVCPFMVSRAISTFFGDTFSITQAVMLTVGTSLLYIGDLEYGVHRFKKELPFLFGHICYGVGQVLIALSPSYF